MIQKLIDKLFYFFLKLSKKQQHWALDEDELKVYALKKQRKKIKVPFYINMRYKVEKFNLNNFSNFKISSKKDSNKVIVYFPGGGGALPITYFHFNFIYKIKKHTNALIYVCNYPLAPNYKFVDIYKYCLNFYRIVLKENKNKEIIFMGDSAGATVAELLTIRLRNKNLKMAKKLILLSPCLDVTLSNEEITTKMAQDRFLSAKGPKFVGKWLFGDKDDSSVNPILENNFKNLPEMHIFIGSYDILMPDVKLFFNKAKTQKEDVYLYEYFKVPHVFTLLTFKESRQSRKKLYEIIKK